MPTADADASQMLILGIPHAPQAAFLGGTLSWSRTGQMWKWGSQVKILLPLEMLLRLQAKPSVILV